MKTYIENKQCCRTINDGKTKSSKLILPDISQFLSTNKRIIQKKRTESEIKLEAEALKHQFDIGGFDYVDNFKTEYEDKMSGLYDEAINNSYLNTSVIILKYLSDSRDSMTNGVAKEHLAEKTDNAVNTLLKNANINATIRTEPLLFYPILQETCKQIQDILNKKVIFDLTSMQKIIQENQSDIINLFFDEKIDIDIVKLYNYIDEIKNFLGIRLGSKKRIPKNTAQAEHQIMVSFDIINKKIDECYTRKVEIDKAHLLNKDKEILFRNIPSNATRDARSIIVDTINNLKVNGDDINHSKEYPENVVVEVCRIWDSFSKVVAHLNIITEIWVSGGETLKSKPRKSTENTKNLMIRIGKKVFNNHIIFKVPPLH